MKRTCGLRKTICSLFNPSHQSIDLSNLVLKNPIQTGTWALNLTNPVRQSAMG